MSQVLIYLFATFCVLERSRCSSSSKICCDFLGKIRCWYWFSEDSLIVYSMLRNRYCERIGREHKSNHGTICSQYIYAMSFELSMYSQLSKNILTLAKTNSDVTVMYIVDLRRGIYYQKCYDPDCRGVYTVPTLCLSKQSESRILFLR